MNAGRFDLEKIPDVEGEASKSIGRLFDILQLCPLLEDCTIHNAASLSASHRKSKYPSLKKLSMTRVKRSKSLEFLNSLSLNLPNLLIDMSHSSLDLLTWCDHPTVKHGNDLEVYIKLKTERGLRYYFADKHVLLPVDESLYLLATQHLRTLNDSNIRVLVPYTPKNDDQATLVQLNQSCKKLYELTIPCLYKSPQFTTFTSFESFANSLSQTNGTFVRRIDLHMVPHRWDSSKITNLLASITEKTLDLEMLNLDLCSQLTNKTLKKITKSLHDLRILSLDQCKMIGDEAIETLAVQCPYLQELYLGSTHITDKALQLLATKFILLTHVFMPGCEHISEQGVSVLTTECKTLVHIDIRDCYNVVGNFEVPNTVQNTDALNTSDDAWEDTEDDGDDDDN
ncbi:hypothetical protein MFLAVUS_005427 [Mucor flavus]|uniref:F-box/LRR-repeat protein 15-like leucin rich repeat domain-containing protein n=1 Tax=Mucor flavus TaxID=439312 RepID=A0ABP9YYN4_9FUNG